MNVQGRHKAKILRKKGYSLKEIARELNVAKSSASLWVRDVELSAQAQNRLLQNISKGQFNSAKSNRAKTRAKELSYFEGAQREIKSLSSENKRIYDKLLCAAMYWCEGAKSASSGVMFVNSDPFLVKKFLELLRASFPLDERKFRVCMHLHSYHSESKQLDFWSEVTHINKAQFIKSYRKPNTGKRIHENYPGCVAIRYHSNDLARQLNETAKAYLGRP